MARSSPWRWSISPRRKTSAISCGDQPEALAVDSRMAMTSAVMSRMLLLCGKARKAAALPGRILGGDGGDLGSPVMRSKQHLVVDRIVVTHDFAGKCFMVHAERVGPGLVLVGRDAAMAALDLRDEGVVAQPHLLGHLALGQPARLAQALQPSAGGDTQGLRVARGALGLR